MQKNTCAQMPAPHEQILAITLGFWQSRALAVAAELEVADLIAEKPLHIDELAAQTKTHAQSLFRLLRALESVGIFSQVSPMIFANTPQSECLQKNAPHSLSAFVRAELSVGGGMYEAWAGLGGSIRTGEKAFDQVYGHDFWEFCRRNPKAGEIFNQAMGEVRNGTSPAVSNSYDWSKFVVIADIGGGLGVQLNSILDAFPSCRGILFEQPQVLEQAIPHERVERISGNFFEQVPTGADVYILNGVIHDWNDSEASIILGKVRQAMKPGARLAVLEDIIPDTPQFSFGKWLDLLMLTIPGGRERTEAEFRKLLSSARFDLEEIIATPAPLSILIAKMQGTV
jgi:O-methyltransferase domain/Dimerisation domain